MTRGEDAACRRSAGARRAVGTTVERVGVVGQTSKSLASGRRSGEEVVREMRPPSAACSRGEPRRHRRSRVRPLDGRVLLLQELRVRGDVGLGKAGCIVGSFLSATPHALGRVALGHETANRRSWTGRTGALVAPRAGGRPRSARGDHPVDRRPVPGPCARPVEARCRPRPTGRHRASPRSRASRPARCPRWPGREMESGCGPAGVGRPGRHVPEDLPPLRRGCRGRGHAAVGLRLQPGA